MKPSLDPEIHLERDDDGRFVATSAALPGYVARADSEGGAIRKMRRALKLNVREQERDFLRLSPREDRDAFRWSRYRTPLNFTWPLSRRVQLSLAAFTAGFLLAGSLTVVARRR